MPGKSNYFARFFPYSSQTRVRFSSNTSPSFSGSRWLLVAVTSIIVIFVTVLLVRRVVRHPLGVAACCMVISGGLGNIIDRVRLGYVVDMFNLLFMNYPVFNVADILVVCGAVLGCIYYLWFYERYDKAVKHHDA